MQAVLQYYELNFWLADNQSHNQSINIDDIGLSPVKGSRFPDEIGDKVVSTIIWHISVALQLDGDLVGEGVYLDDVSYTRPWLV